MSVTYVPAVPGVPRDLPLGPTKRSRVKPGTVIAKSQPVPDLIRDLARRLTKRSRCKTGTGIAS